MLDYDFCSALTMQGYESDKEGKPLDKRRLMAVKSPKKKGPEMAKELAPPVAPSINSKEEVDDELEEVIAQMD